MVLVRQRGRFDCGVAVAATIAQLPYEVVLDRLVTGLTAASALSELVLWRTLQDVTHAEWCMQELWKPWPKLRACSFPNSPAAALLQRTDSSRHYVAASGGWVYDPLLERPVAQTEHPDSGAWVVTLFRLKAPEAE